MHPNYYRSNDTLVQQSFYLLKLIMVQDSFSKNSRDINCVTLYFRKKLVWYYKRRVSIDSVRAKGYINIEANKGSGSFQCIGNDTDSETLYLSITNYDTANIGVKIDSTHAKGYFIFDTNNV